MPIGCRNFWKKMRLVYSSFRPSQGDSIIFNKPIFKYKLYGCGLMISKLVSHIYASY